MEPQDAMRRLHEFFANLGTQPMTITTSSIVRDMLDSYAKIRESRPEDFSWLTEHTLEEAVEQFCISQHCWYFTPRRAPIVEVTFSPERRLSSTQGSTISLHLHYSWRPPVINFVDLQNTVAEADELILKPAISMHRPFSAMTDVSIEYFVECHEDWLHWFDTDKCFRGRVPSALASQGGTQRQDVYTMPLQLSAKVTKQYPGGIRHETSMRCATPLTVKRRPDGCESPMACDHPLPSPVRSFISRRKRQPCPSPSFVREMEVRMISEIKFDHFTPRRGQFRGETMNGDTIRTHNVGEKHYERPNTVMRMSQFNTHVNRRGELDDASDAGSPLESPAAEDIAISPKRRTPRSTSERGSDHWQTPSRRKPKRKVVPSGWVRDLPFDIAEDDNGEELPHTSALLTRSLVIIERGTAAQREQLREALQKIYDEPVPIAASDSPRRKYDAKHGTNRRPPLHPRSHNANVRAKKTNDISRSATTPEIPEKSGKRFLPSSQGRAKLGHDLSCDLSLREGLKIQGPTPRSEKVSEIERHDSMDPESLEHFMERLEHADDSAAKTLKEMTEKRKALSPRRKAAQWQKEIQENFQEMEHQKKVDRFASEDTLPKTPDEEDVTMWDSDTSPYDLDQARETDWAGMVARLT